MTDRERVEQRCADLERQLATVTKERDALRQRLTDQTDQTQQTYWQTYQAVVATLRHHEAIPDGVDPDGHPIEQVVGTCVSHLQCEVERLKAFVGSEEVTSDFQTADGMRAEIVKLTAEVAALRADLARRKRLISCCDCGGWFEYQCLNQSTPDPESSPVCNSCLEKESLRADVGRWKRLYTNLSNQYADCQDVSTDIVQPARIDAARAAGGEHGDAG